MLFQILTRCSTSFRFVPCLAPISQVFQQPMVCMHNLCVNRSLAQSIDKLLMGHNTSFLDEDLHR